MQTDDPRLVSKVSRKDFLKMGVSAMAVTAMGLGVGFAKGIPSHASALSLASGQTTPSNQSDKTAVILADGTQANLNSFAVGRSERVVYPNSNDRIFGSEFVRSWILTRLPSSLGGEVAQLSAFSLLSAVCLKDLKLLTYDGTNENLLCSACSSSYSVSSGQAISGPAAQQISPSNLLPVLRLDIDGAGNLYILRPDMRIEANGEIGCGRYVHGF